MSGHFFESRVQEIRVERGLIAADVARGADMDPSTYNKIDKGKRGVSPQFVRQIAAALQVSQAELYAPIGSSVPPRPEIKGDLPPPTGQRGSNALVTIPEYDISPQAGAGSFPLSMASEDDQAPVDQWAMPRRLIDAFVEDAGALAIIRVMGDSMEPDFFAGERVMVDTGHTTPTPPGIYVLHDGIGLVLKRVEVVFGSSDPATLRISSINPAYGTYERAINEVHINGRVVGKWVWK